MARRKSLKYFSIQSILANGEEKIITKLRSTILYTSSKNIHTEILTPKQVELLPLIDKFQRSFYLVGGTAIGLHLGLRQSIDFDLFTISRLNKMIIKKTFVKIKWNKGSRKVRNEKTQMNAKTLRTLPYFAPFA